MNKREKIIIVGALLAASYGLLDYFIFSDDKKDDKKNDKGAVKVDEEIKNFSAMAASQLTEAGRIDSRRLDYLIKRGEADWFKDPFHEYEPGKQGVEKEDVIHYSGYIQAGKRILAVINGMEYEPGDLLMNLGYRISSITPQRVVLENEVKKGIIIPLEEY